MHTPIEFWRESKIELKQTKKMDAIRLASLSGCARKRNKQYINNATTSEEQVLMDEPTNCVRSKCPNNMHFMLIKSPTFYLGFFFLESKRSECAKLPLFDVRCQLLLRRLQTSPAVAHHMPNIHNFVCVCLVCCSHLIINQEPKKNIYILCVWLVLPLRAGLGPPHTHNKNIKITMKKNKNNKMRRKRKRTSNKWMTNRRFLVSILIFAVLAFRPASHQPMCLPIEKNRVETHIAGLDIIEWDRFRLGRAKDQHDSFAVRSS